MNETENEIIPACMSFVVLVIIVLAAVGYGNVVVAILGLSLMLMMAIMVMFFVYRFLEHCFDIFEDCNESDISDSDDECIPNIDVEDSDVENIIIVPQEQIKLIEEI
tara:strand:+ start:3021 stop:3341 length:321 start_codon:yes stop_codon:yes gene_type:complete